MNAWVDLLPLQPGDEVLVQNPVPRGQIETPSMPHFQIVCVFASIYTRICYNLVSLAQFPSIDGIDLQLRLNLQIRGPVCAALPRFRRLWSSSWGCSPYRWWSGWCGPLTCKGHQRTYALQILCLVKHCYVCRFFITASYGWLCKGLHPLSRGGCVGRC